MLLYHGSNVEVKEPKVLESDRARDFGFAFYLTSLKEQAEKWSKIKVLREQSGQPVVSIFEWDENLEDLNYIDLSNKDNEWIDLVVKCRSDLKYKHEFDIVEGKIADDTVGETINYLLEGVITREMALEKLRYMRANSQTAFCTEKALSHIKFKGSYILK